MNTLDLAAAAAFLGMHPDTLRERAASGIIPGAKPGKRWVFLQVDLAEYLRSQYGSTKPKRKKWRSTNAARASGGSTSGTAADELDALLEPPTRRLRSDTTTNLQLVSGKSGKRGAA